MRSRRFLTGATRVLLAAILAAVELHGWRWSTDRAGREQHAAVVAHLDATDPRWRWEELEADRPDLPDAENSAHLVVEFRRAVPDNPRILGILTGADQPPSLDLEPHLAAPNHQIDAEGARRLDVALNGFEAGWPVVRRLSECRRGRMRTVPPRTWLGPWQVKEERPDALIDCLHWESERLARGGLSDRQETLLLALLNLARIDGGPPEMIHCRPKRLAAIVRQVERLIALDRLGPPLDRLQSEFAAESAADLVRPALRDLRANRDRLFRAIASGELKPRHLMQRDSILTVPMRVWLYQPYFRADWALNLDLLSRVLAIANLPEPAQLDALAAIATPNESYLLSPSCLQAAAGILRRALGTKALLRCTVAALAVERYRLATGGWPDSLTAIPTTILPAVPSDPYTGEPVRLALRADGITIYSVGPDRADNAPHLDHRLGWTEPGFDIGFRLYNPDERRLAPPPPASPRPLPGIDD
jgi:hypothetical protein